MLKITAVQGDITKQEVDAVVNAANTAMRGGGGVDGAIHRAGGAAILHDCVKRFPDGLSTGDAGWTTAGDLPARWVIHAVGPNYTAGQRERSLLESCYRRALTVADELGARVVAFPLISTGVYGWPVRDAVAAAIDTIAAAKTDVKEVRLVAFNDDAYEQVTRQLAFATPVRIFQGVRLLHQRGHHQVRILPGLSPSGMYWRVSITIADNAIGDSAAVHYSSGGATEFAGGEVTAVTTPEAVSDLILRALPEAALRKDDPAYVSWFAGLLSLVERGGSLPIAYSEYFDDSEGWGVGGVRYPHPPKAAGAS